MKRGKAQQTQAFRAKHSLIMRAYWKRRKGNAQAAREANGRIIDYYNSHIAAIIAAWHRACAPDSIDSREWNAISVTVRRRIMEAIKVEGEAR
jgi:hypothetical protein